MRLLGLLPVVALILGGAAVADAPISDEITVDHGYRYPINDYYDGCSIGVDSSGVVMGYRAWSSGNGLVGFRKGPLGEWVDTDEQAVGASEGLRPYRHDLSDHDGTGWKLAFTTRGWQVSPALFVSQVRYDRLSGTEPDLVIVPPGSAELGSVKIRFNGAVHILAWTQTVESSRELRLVRITPGLETLDPEPIVVSPVVADGTIGLACDATGGLLCWISRHGHLKAQRLGPDGLPDGEPFIVQEGSEGTVFGLATVCKLGANYLAAWSPNDGSYRYAVLTPEGEVSQSQLLDDGWMSAGLASCTGRDRSLLVWRACDMVRAGFVDSTGAITAITLDPVSYCDWPAWDWDEFDPQTIDCRWTGSHYVALWSSFHSPPTGIDDYGPYGECNMTAQWIDAAGDPVYPEGLQVDYGAHPFGLVLAHIDDGYVAYLTDSYPAQDQGLIHRLFLDVDGNRVGEVDRYSPADGFDWLSIKSLRRASAFYYRTYFDYDWGACGDFSLKLIKEDGSDLGPFRFSLGCEHPFVFGNFEVAARSDTVLVAYDSRFNDGSGEVFAEMLIPNATVRSYRLPGATLPNDPSVAGAADGFLLVWVDRRTGEAKLYGTLVDRDSPQELSGEPLIESDVNQENPLLIEGANQILCVFMRPVGEDHELLGVRIDPGGSVLDRSPIHLGMSQSAFWSARGVWDGSRYVIAWTEGRDASSYRILMNRVSRTGQVEDGEGFIVDEGHDLGQLATNGRRKVTFTTSGNTFRILVDDLGPEVDTRLIDPRPEIIEYLPPFPNPMRDRVELTIRGIAANSAGVEVFDLRGRRILQLHGRRVADGIAFPWDGRLPDGSPAAAGTYFLRVRDGTATTTRTITLVR